MADTPRLTNTEIAAELQPLAAVIADKIHTVPVRHRPGGADDLIAELTLAVAVYCARNVLPVDAPAAGTRTRGPLVRWYVERHDHDSWVPASSPTRPRERAVQHLSEWRAEHPGHQFRLVRATTTYTAETQHTPEQP